MLFTIYPSSSHKQKTPGDRGLMLWKGKCWMYLHHWRLNGRWIELNIWLPWDSFKHQFLFITIPLNSHGGVIFKFYLTWNPMVIMKVLLYLGIGNTIITPARKLKLIIMPKIRWKNTIVLVIVAYQWLLFAIYFPNVRCQHFPWTNDTLGI